MGGKGKGNPINKASLVDPKLKALILQYSDSIAPKPVILEDLVQFVLTDREYSRKNHQALRTYVSKALENLKLSNNLGTNAKLAIEIGDDDSKEGKLIEEKDYNLMNASLTNSYTSSKERLDKLQESYKSMEIDKKSTNSPSLKRVSEDEDKDKQTPKKKKKIMKKSSQEDSGTQRSSNGIYPSIVPDHGFEILGGIEKVLLEVKIQIERPLLYPQIYNELGVQASRGFLLHGPPGCGKSILADCIAGDISRKLASKTDENGNTNSKLTYFRISAPELVSGMSGESESNIRSLFEAAKNLEPSLIFIDEIDVICGKRDNAQREMERRIVAQLLTSFDDLNRISTESYKRVIVIGATNRLDSIDPSLRRTGRFDKEISLGVPDELARSNILSVQAKNLKLSNEIDFKILAHKTPGYVGSDLLTLIVEASSVAVSRIISGLENQFGEEKAVTQLDQIMNTDMRSHVSISMNDFLEAIKRVQPSAKREGFATIPNVSWEDVGALEDIRQELAMFITEPIKNPKRYQQLGLNTPAGVLLYGPPGCGKTLLAKAIANDVSASFISVKGPELLNKFVGESERAVRKVFERAKLSAPCIIFFDELDALVPKRDDDGNSATKRVVNQLLTELDGLEERKGVFIIAATNRPDIIDSAMLRPQRLDKLLYVPLPDEEARIRILQTLAKKTKLKENVDLVTIAKQCKRFSGADLYALVKEASVITLTRQLQSELEKKSENKMEVEENSTNVNGGVEEELMVGQYDFELALKKVGPSVSEEDEVKYQSLRNQINRVQRG